MTDAYASMLPPPAPPSAAELLAQMKRQSEPESAVTQRDRLLLGAQVLAPSPKLDSSIQNVDKIPSDNLELAARKLQYAEKMSDPDPDAVWRKLEAHPLALQDKPGQLFNRLLGGRKLAEEDWDELAGKLSQVATATEKVADDLTVGAGRVSTVYTADDGVWLTVDFPRGGSDTLPMSLSGKPSRALPPATLDWPAGEGITAFAGPSDVVYAADADDETDFQLRQLRPGPAGKDGKPRWVAVQPLPVRSHTAVEGVTAGTEGAVVDAYLADGYPGTKGGDWIVWDVPADAKGWREPAFMKGKSRRITGGVASTGPEYPLTPLPREKVPDPRALTARLDDTAWAIFEAQGDPASTSHLVSRLKRQGFDPIEATQDSGRKSWLVFGVDPDTAHQLSPKRTVWTNSGASRDDEPRTFHIRTAGGTVSFQPDGSLSAPGIPRAQRRVDRWAFQVDPDQAKRLAGFASNLEAVGAQNVSIYSREHSIEGFEPAREYLYSDGISTRVVRTASKRVGDSNAIPLHVRSTAGWPSDRPNVGGDAIDLRGRTLEGEDLERVVQDAAVFAAAGLPAKVKGLKLHTVN
jgi:hypothetical protein